MICFNCYKETLRSTRDVPRLLEGDCYQRMIVVMWRGPVRVFRSEAGTVICFFENRVIDTIAIIVYTQCNWHIVPHVACKIATARHVIPIVAQRTYTTHRRPDRKSNSLRLHLPKQGGISTLIVHRRRRISHKFLGEGTMAELFPPRNAFPILLRRQV